MLYGKLRRYSLISALIAWLRVNPRRNAARADALSTCLRINSGSYRERGSQGGEGARDGTKFCRVDVMCGRSPCRPHSGGVLCVCVAINAYRTASGERGVGKDITLMSGWRKKGDAVGSIRRGRERATGLAVVAHMRRGWLGRY